MRNSVLLESGQLQPEEFLNRMVYKKNNLTFGLLDVDLVSQIPDEEEFLEETEPDSTSQPQTQSQSSSNGYCIACEEGQPQMCFIPCFHLCICESCWNLAQSTKSTKCPACSTEPTDVKRMNFV